MLRVTVPLLLLVCGPAWAVELPDSARRLIPLEWSTPLDLEEPATGDWVLTLGGSDLVQLADLSDRVATVATADSQLAQAQGRELQAAAGLLPRLAGSASWQTGTPSANFAALDGTSAMDQSNLAADLTVPLSLWTSLPTQRAARADRHGARSTLLDARATALIDLASAFLDCAQAEQSLAVVRSQLAVAQDLLTVAEARYGAGEVTGVDVLQQRQQLASTRADLPAAAAEVGRARRALAALLRLPADALPDVLPAELPEPVLLPLPSPRDLVEREPGVVASLRSWEAARSRTRSARAGLLPDLSLTASTGARYTELVDTAITPTWSAGIQATVPVFDGGTTLGRIRESSGAETQALVALEQAVVDVVLGIEDAIALWHQAADARASADEAERLAVDALAAAQAGYSAGTSTYNTVLTSTQTVRSTRQAAILAQRAHVDAALGVVSATRATWAAQESMP